MPRKIWSGPVLPPPKFPGVAMESCLLAKVRKEKKKKDKRKKYLRDKKIIARSDTSGLRFLIVPHINNRPLKPSLSYAKLKLNRQVGRQRQPLFFLPCERQIRD
jgi:hypothetical protein